MKRIALFLIPVLLLLMLCVSCSQNVSPELYYGMYSHLSEVWAQSLAHTDAKVAFFGDSRVIGADWNAAYPDSKVINLGVGGDKVSQLLVRLNQVQVLVQTGQLQCVFLAIGGNDCLGGADMNTFRTQYDSLLSSLQDLGLTVYVNTVAAVREGALNASRTKKANNLLKQANEIIKELAENHGMEVFDMAALMDGEDGMLKAEYAVEDGVHFCAAGNQLWFDTLRPAVQLYD